MALSNKRVGKMLWEYILRHFFGILMDFDLKQHEKLHPERGGNAKEKESQWSETPSCKEEWHNQSLFSREIYIYNCCIS